MGARRRGAGRRHQSPTNVMEMGGVAERYPMSGRQNGGAVGRPVWSRVGIHGERSRVQEEASIKAMSRGSM